MELEWREYCTVPAGMAEIHHFDELIGTEIPLIRTAPNTGLYQTISDVPANIGHLSRKNESASTENNKKKEEKVVIDSPLRSVATTSKSPVISPSPTGYFFSI